MVPTSQICAYLNSAQTQVKVFLLLRSQDVTILNKKYILFPPAVVSTWNVSSNISVFNYNIHQKKTFLVFNGSSSSSLAVLNSDGTSAVVMTSLPGNILPIATGDASFLFLLSIDTTSYKQTLVNSLSAFGVSPKYLFHNSIQLSVEIVHNKVKTTTPLNETIIDMMWDNSTSSCSFLLLGEKMLLMLGYVCAESMYAWVSILTPAGNHDLQLIVLDTVEGQRTKTLATYNEVHDLS